MSALVGQVEMGDMDEEEGGRRRTGRRRRGEEEREGEREGEGEGEGEREGGGGRGRGRGRREEEEEEGGCTHWEELDEDVKERILSRLPVTDAVRSGAVCREWKWTVSSKAEVERRGKPWFFLFGVNELVHVRSQVFAFDPDAWHWNRLKPTRPPPFDRASFSGDARLFFAFNLSKLCYVSVPIKMLWRQTPPSLSSRCNAVLGVVGDPDAPPFKFILAGGVLDGDHSAVEMYSSSSNTWEFCPPLPGEFRGGKTSQWLSAVVFEGHFFVLEIHTGVIAALDVETKLWDKVGNLALNRPSSAFLLVWNGHLTVAAVCEEAAGAAGAGVGAGGRQCLTLWGVNATTMECKERSRMPQELFSLFENEDEEKQACLKCVGSGDLIYVYSECLHKEYPVCVCETKEGEGGGVAWSRLPPLPSPLPRFDRVICCAPPVSAKACLNLKKGCCQ